MATGYAHQLRSRFLKMLNEWHCPSLGELSFQAIYIHQTVPLSSSVVTICTATMVLLCLVLACWLVHGDWTIAWSVGCFFATLAAILLVNHSNGSK
jgi:hypothetical protein